MFIEKRDRESRRFKMDIALVIPAYNEEETISEVLETAKQANLFSEIVVVSDGSTDNTVQKVLEAGVQAVALPDNQGKGAAMKIGLENTSSDLIVFLDADLVNLDHHHLEKLVKPVIKGTADMSCGIFKSGRDVTDFGHKIVPWLTGQRAVKREVIENCADLTDSKYGAELSITREAIQQELRVKKVSLKGLTHKTKEEKIGPIKGFFARVRMCWQVFNYFRKHNLSYNSLNTMME